MSMISKGNVLKQLKCIDLHGLTFERFRRTYLSGVQWRPSMHGEKGRQPEAETVEIV